MPECRLLAAKLAEHQIPSLGLRHREAEWGDQPPGREIVVDVRADADRDTDAVDRGLQRMAVIFEQRSLDRSFGGKLRDACGLEPARPVAFRMGDAQQRLVLE